MVERERLTSRPIGMDYCLGDGDGSAAIWSGEPVLDIDGDGELDAISLDVDGDGRFDDAVADLDHDGFADHVVFDLGGVAGLPAGGGPESYFTDDGSGTWAVAADGSDRSGQLRWFGLDGIEHPGGPARVDFDGDGQVDDRLVDVNRDGLADRVRSGEKAFVDTDGDGRWDVTLSDVDGDGRSDAAAEL
jgi:hypothetical protein